MSENLTKMISPKNLYNGSVYNIKGRNSKEHKKYQARGNEEMKGGRENYQRILSPETENKV